MAEGPEVKVVLTGDNAGALGAIRGTGEAIQGVSQEIVAANERIAGSVTATVAQEDSAYAREVADLEAAMLATSSYEQAVVQLELAMGNGLKTMESNIAATSQMAAQDERAALAAQQQAAAAESAAIAEFQRRLAIGEVTIALNSEITAENLLTGATREAAEAESFLAGVEARREDILVGLAQGTQRVRDATKQLAATTPEMVGYGFAVDTLTGFVTQLEAAITKARARGAPISPTAVQELNAAKAALAGVNAEMELTSVAGGKLEGSTKRLSIEAAGARASWGGLAQVLARTGGVFAEVLLPLLLVQAAFELIPRLLDNVAAAGTGMGNALAKLTGGIVEEDKEVEKLNNELAKLDQRHKAAADAADIQQRAGIRIAAGLQHETADVKVTEVAWEAYQNRLHHVAEVSDAFQKKMQSLGIVVRDSFKTVQAEVDAFIEHYRNVMEVQGPAAAKRYAEDNKAFLQKATEAFQDHGTKAPAELEKIRRGLNLLLEDEKKLQAQEGLKKHFLELSDAIAKGAAQYGSMRVAVQALEGPISSLIDKYEAQRAAGTKLTEQQEREVLAMRQWLLDANLLGKGKDDLRTKIDALAKAWAGEVAALDEANKKYDEHKAKIESTRKAAVDAEYGLVAAVQKSTQEQIASLTVRWKTGELGNREYFGEVATLQLKEVDTRRDAEKKIDTINDEAAKSQDDLKKDYEKSMTAINAKLKEHGDSLEELRKVSEKVTASAKDMTGQIGAQAKAHEDAAPKVTKHSTAQDVLSGHLKTVSERAADHLVKMKEVGEKHDQVHPKVKKTAEVTLELNENMERLASSGIAKVESGMDSLMGKADALIAKLAQVGAAAEEAFG